MKDPGDIILFQTEDGQTRIDVRLVGEMVRLSAGQIARNSSSTINTYLTSASRMFSMREN